MKKVVFKNPYYYKGLIAILLILLIYNTYWVFFGNNLVGLIPVLVQSVLLYLIAVNHALSKKAIQFWALIFLVLAQFLRILGRFMKDFAIDFKDADLIFYLQAICVLLLGLVIHEYAKDTITIEEIA
jgi:hypothetical protein